LFRTEFFSMTTFKGISVDSVHTRSCSCFGLDLSVLTLTRVEEASAIIS
jgi:hypothetical protein